MLEYTSLHNVNSVLLLANILFLQNLQKFMHADHFSSLVHCNYDSLGIFEMVLN